MQTKYSNEITRLEEWRCRYCATVYLTSGSTSGPLRNSAREIQAKNVQQSLQAAFAQVEANPYKRRRLNIEEVSQDKLESL